jgi:ribosomal protein L28
MSAHCQLTGTAPVFGNNVSHSHRRTRRRWTPNIQHRRSQRKATAPDLVPITVDSREPLVPRRLVRAYRRGLITP